MRKSPEIFPDRICDRPDNQRKEIISGISYRYLLSSISLIILLFFHTYLPFPFPDFTILVAVFLLFNVVFNLLWVVRWSPRTLYTVSPYIDIFFAPFIFHYTGGFLSPFILANYSTVIGSGIIYREKTTINRNLIIALLFSYISVALLQKIGVVTNPVEFSRQMMDHDFFFFFVFINTVLVITGAFPLIAIIQKNVHQQLDDMVHTYRKIVTGTVVANGTDFYATFTRAIAEALNADHVLLAKLTSSGESIETLAVYRNGILYPNFTQLMIGSPFERIIREGGYYLEKSLYLQFTGQLFLGNANAESLYGQALNGADGKPVGILCVIREYPSSFSSFTDSIMKIFATKAAAEVDRINRESERDHMREELFQAQKMQAIGQLAGGVAHDFNNMLTTVMGFASVLGKKLKSIAPEYTSYTDKIITTSKRSSDLIKQMLTFAHKGNFNAVPLDIHSVISGVVDMLTHITPKNICIDTKLEASKAIIMGDFSQTQSMLLNLGINARDAMPQGGKLTFTTSMYKDNTKDPVRDYICILVSDTGNGIDDEVLKHLFEPFFTTKGIGKGTGLGLASVYGCVKNHDGVIDVHSSPGNGATFKICFPLIEQDKTTGMVAILDDINKSLITNYDDNPMILMIDDNEDFLTTCREHLKGCGFDFHGFFSGVDAVTWYRSNWEHVKLILLDVMMPVMSGGQVYKELRIIDPNAQIAIITGYSSDKEMGDIDISTIAETIQKPVTPQELEKCINCILTKTR
jgi:signal transduction histidine kinase